MIPRVVFFFPFSSSLLLRPAPAPSSLPMSSSSKIPPSAATGSSDRGAKALLPPPEKPLPGDCCGSGCVRCVWDVYYEELEEYNKQLSSISEDKKKAEDMKSASF